MLLRVTAHPRATRPRVELDGRKVHVWVHEPATDGRANVAVIRAVASWLDVAPSRLRLARGATGRVKLVDIGDVPLPPAGKT